MESMIISKDHRFIFIAVPKTASSACEFVLRRHGDFFKTIRHMPAHNVKNHIGPDWSSYRSLAVIRHPVDWLHSWYKFWSAAAKDPRTGVPVHNQLPNMPFAEFVGRTLEDRDRHWEHVGTQADRICDDATGEVLVSQLLCFDYLGAQFTKTLAGLGLPAVALPERNVSKMQPALPALPENLLAEVRRYWRHDFLLYSRGYHDFAQDLAAAGEPVPPPKFDVVPLSAVAAEQSVLEAECKARGHRWPRPANSWQNIPVPDISDEEDTVESARDKVKRQPEDARAHLRLGNLLLKAGDIDAAALALRRSMSLNPHLVRTYRLLSAVLLKQGDVAQAVAVFREAVARAPNSPELLKQLARYLRKQGHTEEAAAELKRAEALESANAAEANSRAMASRG